MSNAGIASATGTRLDSAAKHTMPCKIDDMLLVSWFNNKEGARVALHVHKYKYAVQKDELVLNVTQKLKKKTATSKAYPAVVSALSDMRLECRGALRLLYEQPTALDFIAFSRKPVFPLVTGSTYAGGVVSDSATLTDLITMWSEMPYFTAQGYALGTAYASPVSGDTVSTVLVGGMVTVRNGAFSCCAGQPIMWYFDFEEMCFANTNTQTASEAERIDWLDKQGDRDQAYQTSVSGRKRRMEQQYDTWAVGNTKSGVALPKPYVLKNGDDVYGDKIRIFAKCINGGRAFDMIDIMLMTQSL